MSERHERHSQRELAMSERHELWDELEAFDPRWQIHYATTELAAFAAGVCALWRDYCHSRWDTMACSPRQVIDTVGLIRREQQAASSSSLPYRLDTIGTVRQAEE